MACRIADNPALERLRADIGADRLCHSQRVDCIRRLPRAENEGFYGIAGAFMGYCQALFALKGSRASNTERITALLERENLPWARSHELFHGHRRELTVGEFVTQAAAPLRHFGRVPILISGLDPDADAEEVQEIFSSPAQVIPGETILVRLVVRSDASFEALEKLLRRLVDTASRERQMPRWWPLIQSGGSPAQWSALRKRLGPLWRYVNIAVNPFTPSDQWEILADQIMVTQFVVPHSRDITGDGDVRVTEGMKIAGAPPEASYNICEMIAAAGGLRSWPTAIFLGPALDCWSDDENANRVAKAVRIFTAEVERQWSQSGHGRYAELLKMAA